jgi:hypothetical protein
MEKHLAREMLKFLAYTRLGQDFVSPTVAGAFELQTPEPGANYRVDVYSMAGQQLLTLPALFATRSEDLQDARQHVYAAQSAVLAEWVQTLLPEPERIGPAPGLSWDLPGLAARLGMTGERAAAEYDRYLYDRLANESILTAPAARQRVPEELLTALEAECRALNGRHHDLPGHPVGLGRRVQHRPCAGVVHAAQRRPSGRCHGSALEADEGRLDDDRRLPPAAVKRRRPRECPGGDDALSVQRKHINRAPHLLEVCKQLGPVVERVGHDFEQPF